jgi:hypothetical protein
MNARFGRDWGASDLSVEIWDWVEAAAAARWGTSSKTAGGTGRGHNSQALLDQ